MRAEKRHVERRVGPTGALGVEQHRRARDVDENVLRAHVAVNRARCDKSSDGRPLRAGDARPRGWSPSRRRRTARGAAPTAGPCCRTTARVRGCCALRVCSAAKQLAHFGADGRTHQTLHQLHFPVRPARRDRTSRVSRCPPAGSSATTAGTWRGATPAAKRNQRTSSALRRTGASHSCATLRRGSARFTQYVLSPTSTRHSSDDTPATIGVNIASRHAEPRPSKQRFGATRQIGVDIAMRIQRPKTLRRPATALSIARLHRATAVRSSRESRGSIRRSARSPRHAGRFQLVRIRFAFVAQRIEFRGHDQCARQLREVLRVQRCCHRIGPCRAAFGRYVSQNHCMPASVSR